MFRQLTASTSLRQRPAHWYAFVTMLDGKLAKPHLVIACAWMLHAISWFLPVIKPGGLFTARGWFAFLVALSSIWDSGHFDAWYYVALSAISAVTTLLFVVGSPWVVWRGSRSACNASAWVATVAFVVNSHWYVLSGSDRKDLSIGYFLWWLSFSLLAIGLFGLSSQSRIDEHGQMNCAEANC